mgnify:CR=1 FL=1
MALGEINAVVVVRRAMKGGVGQVLLRKMPLQNPIVRILALCEFSKLSSILFRIRNLSERFFQTQLYKIKYIT